MVKRKSLSAVFIWANNANPSMFVDELEKAKQEGTSRKKAKKPFGVLYGRNRYFCVCDKAN